jgi:cell division protein FtsB
MRYEEAAQQRAELESVKRENEVLRARVKELEKSLQRANEPSEPALPALSLPSSES